MNEHLLQTACFQYFRMAHRQYADDYFSIPNGMWSKNLFAALKMKREGLKKGVFDSFLAVPSKGYAGLWIEFKSTAGRLTDEQKTFKARMERNGYKAIVIKQFDEFKAEVKNYLVGGINAASGT